MTFLFSADTTEQMPLLPSQIAAASRAERISVIETQMSHPRRVPPMAASRNRFSTEEAASSNLDPKMDEFAMYDK